MNEPYDLSHIVSVIWNKEDVYGLLKDTHKETTLSKKFKYTEIFSLCAKTSISWMCLRS